MSRLGRLIVSATSTSSGITHKTPRCSFFIRSYGTLQEHDEASVTLRNNNDSNESRNRNPVFASVLREGMPLLHEAVEIIQKSSQSRQPFRIDQDDPNSSKNDERKNSPKFQYTLYHVRTAASQCLETNLMMQDATTVGEWCVKGEPVDIVHVRLSSSLQHVTLYWTIPYSLWLLDENRLESKSNTGEQAVDHILELQEVLNKRWTAGKPNAASRMAGKIQRYLISNNKWARAPSVRLEPATPSMLYDLLTPDENGSS